jgi:hypothetical protein
METQKNSRTSEKQKAATALQALGIVAVYFGIVVALMYPVADAAGYLA